MYVIITSLIDLFIYLFIHLFKTTVLEFQFQLFCVHLIHKGYEPSDMELLNSESKVTNIIHDVR
jgi:hypothetical protein